MRKAVLVFDSFFLVAAIGSFAAGADPAPQVEGERRPAASARPQSPVVAKDRSPEERFRFAIDQCLKLPSKTKLNKGQTVVYNQLRELMAPRLAEMFRRMNDSQDRLDRNAARKDLALAKDEIRQDVRWILDGFQTKTAPPPAACAPANPVSEEDVMRYRLYQLECLACENQFWNQELLEQQAGLKDEIKRLKEVENDRSQDPLPLKREVQRLEGIAKILEQGQSNLNKDLNFCQHEQRDLAKHLGIDIPADGSGHGVPPTAGTGQPAPGSTVASGATISSGSGRVSPGAASSKGDAGPEAIAAKVASARGQGESPSRNDARRGASAGAQSGRRFLFGRDPGLFYGRGGNSGSSAFGTDRPDGAQSSGGYGDNPLNGEFGGRGLGFPREGRAPANPRINGGEQNLVPPAARGTGGALNGSGRESGGRDDRKDDKKEKDDSKDDKHDQRR